jgi:hypothetical protein
VALSSYHFLLDQRLQRIDLAVILALNKLDFSESTLTDDLESGEVVWLLLCSQESQVLDFGIAHAQLLLGLTVVRDGRFLHDRFKLQRSGVVSVMFDEGKIHLVPLVAVACSLDAVLEESVDQTLGHGRRLGDVAGVLLRVPGRGFLVVQ